jgi:hypothetical protein
MKKFLYSFVVFIIFSYHLVFSLFLDPNIQTKFLQDTPEFTALLNAVDPGKRFEIEAALCRLIGGEKVYGFGLEIFVLDSGKNPITVNVNGNPFKVITTEYDIVTPNFVFECKSSSVPANHKKPFMKQFLKEQQMLLLFKNIWNELQDEQSKIFFSICLKKKKKQAVLTVCGESTDFKDIHFVSNWIKGTDLDSCSEQWLNLVEFLANKKLIVLFKEAIPQGFKKNMDSRDLRYCDDVDYKKLLRAGSPSCQDLAAYQQMLIDMQSCKI